MKQNGIGSKPRVIVVVEQANGNMGNERFDLNY